MSPGNPWTTCCVTSGSPFPAVPQGRAGAAHRDDHQRQLRLRHRHGEPAGGAHVDAFRFEVRSALLRGLADCGGPPLRISRCFSRRTPHPVCLLRAKRDPRCHYRLCLGRAPSADLVLKSVLLHRQHSHLCMSVSADVDGGKRHHDRR